MSVILTFFLFGTECVPSMTYLILKIEIMSINKKLLN